jgi:pimeloyl-ACP methyl ester carboxylesterase
VATITRAAPGLPVTDLEAAFAHYRRLGFATRTYEGGGYGFLTRDGVELHLGVVPEVDKTGAKHSAYLFVDDADALAEEWRAAGVEVNLPISTPRGASTRVRWSIPTATSSASARRWRSPSRSRELGLAGWIGSRCTSAHDRRGSAAMAYAEIGDVRLFFTEHGSGDPPILMVHGFSCDGQDWMWQIPYFAERHRVIVVDLRGHGRSSVPEQGYEPKQFAADVAGLLQELGVGPVVAMGHSLGGAIVSALAVEHPALVSAVVSVDPGYLLADEVRPVVEGMVTALGSDDPVAASQQFLSASYAPATPPALKAFHMRRIAGVPGPVLVATLSGLFVGPDSLGYRDTSVPYLQRRSCPVLAVYMDADRAAFEADLLADPRSRAIAWPGSGHWLHQERPAEFNAVVDEWLTSL